MKLKLLLALTFIGALLPTIAMAATSSSLRIMTYNTAFMVIDVGFPIGEIEFNGGSFGGLDYEHRAEAIAKAVLAGDNDVVVFNEVFSSTAKAVLVKNLSSTYHHYISEIRGKAPNPYAALAEGLLQFVPDGLKPATNDSGLMIFSKFPFVPFSPTAYPMQEGVTDIEGDNGGIPWGSSPKEVSVYTYTVSNHEDGLASKAVAMVRVQQGKGQISNIAFTHMQADAKYYDGESIATRSYQFENIEKFIRNSLTDEERASQPLYLLGDLNVVGGNKNDPGPIPEWQNTFHPTGSVANAFFGCGNGVCGTDKYFMTDSWGFETSVDDPGETNNIDKARLDYILHNRPAVPGSTNSLCMQYIAKASEATMATTGGEQQLSDHFPVRADFNKKAPHCSANDSDLTYGPTEIKFGAAQNIPFKGIITYPGSMQWYRIGIAGSYSLKFSGANAAHMGYEVYAGSDMSTPLPPFYDEVNARYGPKHVLPRPPYYIRVFAIDPVSKQPDRNWSDNTYTLNIHEYRGTSPDDSIGLAGGITNPYTWPGPNSLEYPEVWFDFHTNQADSGNYPDIDFYHEVPVSQDLSLFNLTLSDKITNSSGTTYPQIPFTGTAGFVDDSSPLNPGIAYAAPKLPGSGGAPKKYYLKLSRDQFLLKNVPMTTWLTFGTTFTYIKPDVLLSLDMNDDSPDRDNPELQFTYDGPWDKPDCSAMVCPGPECLGPVPFSKDDPLTISGFKPFQKTFVDNVVFNLRSEGFCFAEYTWKQVVGTSALGHFEGQCDPCNIALWADGGNVDDADFWYKMPYSMSHDQTPY
ncbi:MAG: hypothetical protein HGA96_11110 [Desulfobulbaceae bacterium]|nr:hypothetical protein [Desulfobulbaceae bacterium]